MPKLLELLASIYRRDHTLLRYPEAQAILLSIRKVKIFLKKHLSPKSNKVKATHTFGGSW
jgi:hypothetical protein